jgi:hypothetical protein
VQGQQPAPAADNTNVAQPTTVSATDSKSAPKADKKKESTSKKKKKKGLGKLNPF